ncbi:MAG: thioredoxin family protein [Syntrophobacteraceae bacterium]|jgi:hypothetical protein|nr:thioredoxin family protein [Syntrophobacteraceae bacterium]
MAIVEEEAVRIRQWGDTLSRPIPIRLRTTPDPRTKELDRFLEDMARCTGKVRIVREEGEPGELPAIFVSESLTYQALPLEAELEPFLHLLSPDEERKEAPEAALRMRLDQIVWPAELRVFIAPGCPHCPEAVRRIGPLALVQPWIHITIVDAILFPELSEPLGIRSVPTVVLDSAFRWTGTVEMGELLDTLIHRDGTQLPASSLKALLKDGQAHRLAALMLDRGEIFPAFADLLTHPEWSVRLGALVVAEEIAEKDPGLAGAILPPLWERFAAADVTVQGDILYVTGLAGSPGTWAGPLKTFLASNPTDDLRETAEEVLTRWGSPDPA